MDEMLEPIKQPKLKTIHHSPLVYRVYDELKKNIGKENAISAEELSSQFGLSHRRLRTVIREIRNSTELEKAIGSSDKGYYVCTIDDIDASIQRLLNYAFSTLKVARAIEKKAGRNGQIKMQLGKYFKEYYQSLGE